GGPVSPFSCEASSCSRQPRPLGGVACGASSYRGGGGLFFVALFLPLLLALFPLLAALFLHRVFLLALFRGQHAVDAGLGAFAQGFHLAAVIFKDDADFLALCIVELQFLGN